MIGFLKPPRDHPQMPDERIGAAYTRLRWQVYRGIFIGYAGYYLVRKIFPLAMPLADHVCEWNDVNIPDCPIVDILSTLPDANIKSSN